MIGINDKVKVFKDKNNQDIIFGSSPISEGDTVMVIPSKAGDDIVVKNGPISEGDYVGILPTADGDYVVIKPGGCLPIDVSLVRTWLGTHRSYTYRLSEDFSYINRFDYPQLNLTIDFNLKCDGGTFPPEGPTIPRMYPCGAVWVGLGSPDSYGNFDQGTWLWRLWPNPYATLGFGYDMDLRTNMSMGPYMGKLVENNGILNRWCIPNFLSYYTGGHNAVNGFKVRYIHVHIRNTISLFFGGDGGSVSSIADLNVCLGEADPGWCGGAFDEGE